MKDDRVYLLHIRECVDHIQEFTTGGREEFLRGRKTQDAVLRNLQTLAESATRISAPLRERHPEVDCRLLTPYAVMLRYPGAADEPSEEDGRGAVAAAERVYQHLRKALDNEGMTLDADNYSLDERSRSARLTSALWLQAPHRGRFSVA